MALDPVNILIGVGRMYVAPLGTTFPIVTATPAAPWADLGETQDGVTVTPDQEIEEISVDQETGPVEAARTAETLVIETKLALATLENLAVVMGGTVTDVPAASAVIGTRALGLYRGFTLTKFAFLFRGDSPYVEGYPAQYEVPRGYFAGSAEAEHVKDGNVAYPVEFHALVDPYASSESVKFGRLIVQDAAALP